MTALVPEPDMPQLDLSGPVLRESLVDLGKCCEAYGGVEAVVALLRLKAAGFAAVLGEGKAARLSEAEFVELGSFIAPIRRRAGKWLAEYDFAVMRERIGKLLEGQPGPREAGARIEAFSTSFAQEGAPRWARDLAAEVLHFMFPEQVPLMTRWMWDASTGTGVLRQIWFEPDSLAGGIKVADDASTFMMLREELTEFLRGSGVFRDMEFMIDLLCAHVYGAYIDRCGNALFKTQFPSGRDGLVHTRRLLGLDAAAQHQRGKFAA